MSGIGRLIEGLQAGDKKAVIILIFAVLTTAAIYLVTQAIQKRRKSKL